MYRIPYLTYANKRGEVYDHQELQMACRSANFTFVPYEIELIELPEDGRLFSLHDRAACAYNEETTNMETFSGGNAVAAILPDAYLRLFLPASGDGKELPLFALTAVGWLEESFVVPALRMESYIRPLRRKADPKAEAVSKNLMTLSGNKLASWLASAAVKENCPITQDGLTGQVELVIPVGTDLLAQPVADISPYAGTPVANSHRGYVPSLKDVMEVVETISATSDIPVITFATTTTGDPLAAHEQVAKCISAIKKKFPKITINYCGTPAHPDKLKSLIDAGLDSMRVMMPSVVEGTFDTFFATPGFKLEGILRSIELATRHNVLVSLGVAALPGMTDRESEAQAMVDFIDAFKIPLVLFSNIPGDADAVFKHFTFKYEEIYGMKNMLKLLKKKFKSIQFGHYNRTKDTFLQDSGYPDLKRKAALDKKKPAHD